MYQIWVFFKAQIFKMCKKGCFQKAQMFEMCKRKKKNVYNNHFLKYKFKTLFYFKVRVLGAFHH